MKELLLIKKGKNSDNGEKNKKILWSNSDAMNYRYYCAMIDLKSETTENED